MQLLLNCPLARERFFRRGEHGVRLGRAERKAAVRAPACAEHFAQALRPAGGRLLRSRHRVRRGGGRPALAVIAAAADAGRSAAVLPAVGPGRAARLDLLTGEAAAHVAVALGVVAAAAGCAVALVEVCVLPVGRGALTRRVLRLAAQAEAAVAAVAEGFRAVALAEGIVHELRCDARERIGIRDAAQARQLRRERREDLPANVRARGGRRRKDRRLHLGPDGGERRSPTRDARERKSLQLIEQRRERAAGCGRLELRITHEAQQRQIAGKAAAEDVIRARLLQNVQYPVPEQRPGLGREGIVRVKICAGIRRERRADVPVGAAVVLDLAREQHAQRGRPVAGVKIRAQQIFRPADGDGRAVRRAAQTIVRRDGIDPDIPRDEQCEAALEQRRDGIMRQKRPVARQRGVKSVHPAAPCSQ